MVLFARQLMFDRQEAEDAVQEAFVRFVPRHNVADPVAYSLYTCIRRCALECSAEPGDGPAGKKKQRGPEGQPNDVLFICP